MKINEHLPHIHQHRRVKNLIPVYHPICDFGYTCPAGHANCMVKIVNAIENVTADYEWVDTDSASVPKIHDFPHRHFHYPGFCDNGNTYVRTRAHYDFCPVGHTNCRQVPFYSEWIVTSVWVDTSEGYWTGWSEKKLNNKSHFHSSSWYGFTINKRDFMVCEDWEICPAGHENCVSTTDLFSRSLVLPERVFNEVSGYTTYSIG
jgi:hypothetical protein